MTRKRTPHLPTTDTGPSSATTVLDPATEPQSEQSQSFVERLGERRNRIAIPDPFGIASDFAAGVKLFESRQDREMAIKFEKSRTRKSSIGSRTLVIGGTTKTRYGCIPCALNRLARLESKRSDCTWKSAKWFVATRELNPHRAFLSDASGRIPL